MAEEVETKLSNMDLESNGEVKKNGSPEIQEEVDAGGKGNTVQLPPHGFGRMSSALEDPHYKMTHKRRGYCVIFNHSTFNSILQLGDRSGTDRDRDQMEKLFFELGYEVKVYNNLTVQKLNNAVRELGQEIDHTDCDSLVVVFMSHGEQDILYGQDAQFKAEKLWSEFTSDKCSSLAGKPKLFFIQACRGDMLDKGVTLVKVPRDEVDGGAFSYKIPTQADFLICWSTVPGYFSWRNTSNGSWFVQSVVEIFRREHAHKDVLSMLTSVNRFMIANFESNTPSQAHMHGKKQTAYIVSTLMRDVYLHKKNQ
ncbi:death caspase-1 [Oratosquilla oratoria]|uniref:death caspase-1 n=1 Tax=Oratosquilla oratoria TaxID=337810 RepID=UPI003F757AD0